MVFTFPACTQLGADCCRTVCFPLVLRTLLWITVCGLLHPIDQYHLIAAEAIAYINYPHNWGTTEWFSWAALIDF